MQREVSVAMESNDHSVDILDHVLDLSKLEAGKLILEQVPMNVHTVCISALGTMNHLTKPGVNLLLQCALDVWVMGSSRHFKQVIINLLGNAIRHTESGFVKIEIEEHPAESVTDKRLNLTVRVSDTGVGIPPESREQLFSKYVQSGFQAVGTGLGLVISQAIIVLHQKSLGKNPPGIQIVSPVERNYEFWRDMKKKSFCLEQNVEKKSPEPWHSSSVEEYRESVGKADTQDGDAEPEVEAKPGPGSMFYFTIPMERCAPEASEKKRAFAILSDKMSPSDLLQLKEQSGYDVSKAPAGDRLPPNIRVLVIDDEESPNRRLMVRKLTSMGQFKGLGWTCGQAINGEDGVRQVVEAGHSWDIITIDQNMTRTGGQISGNETAKQIRELEEKSTTGRRAILICATGNCTAHDLVLHRQHGMDLTWSKPFPKPDEMYDDIMRLMQTHGWPQLGQSEPKIDVTKRLRPDSIVIQSFSGSKREARCSGSGQVSPFLPNLEFSAAQATHKSAAEAEFLNKLAPGAE